ncbi:type I polyketide synthase [Streptomyces liangshanensis]|uniref:Acyltransferase domain-containing protein n=1 Tax=Streptomyces liangshanensis TaxID=2717324 RepID=A0A6G9GVA0_9ACTN|nr:type I polyketide synthase [Streptomyces liangshanensis]QIQ01857.1 acyltransferase domain-containing protein [Streptomyces liangshanensis]
MSETPAREPAPGPDEPLAVVGMACRFPGAEDLDAFWNLLLSGSDAIGPGPQWRAGRRPGGYLDSVDHFDAEFFAMSPYEAAAADPQQRLLLELTWHALENARIRPDSLSGSRTGVFVGACADDYAMLSRVAGAPTPYTLTGAGRAFLANRVSHSFGFTGPSLVVDTGQSSSLSALHQAAHAVRRGECATAIVAGVQLNLSAEGDEVVEAIGALSPAGRCHTFDARADGIVRGEGAGVLVLRPLDRAVAAGDRVYCTVLGTAMNNDGGSTGLTAPSRAAQQDLVATAHRRAGVSPRDVDYVELHGTGTALGDPVEASALGGVFAPGRSPGEALLVGSVKTNIGHLEGAAGIAGFIKTALALHHRELPASLNYREPNPAIDLAALRLRVCDERRPWPDAATPLVAGVSSFGLGGTNCHAVLGEAPVRPDRAPAPAATAVPVMVSGHTEAAMRRQAALLADELGAPGTDPRAPADLGLASVTTRTAFRHRAAVVASGTDRLALRLRALADGAPDGSDGIVRGGPDSGLTAFLIPGQGSQREGMGRRLHKEFGAFTRAFDEVSEALETGLGVSLSDAMGEDHGPAGLRYVPPALFALEVGLYRLLESWGLVPDLLLGHSQGEITAAHVTGILSLQDAATLVAERSRLIHALPPGGAMIAVQARETEAAEVIAAQSGLVGIAAVNSPMSVVVSGEERATRKVAERFEALGRRTRRLRVAAAGHSPLMAPAQEGLRAVAGQLTWHRHSGPVIVSTVTGRPVAPEEMSTPDYWIRHICAPVRFGPALDRAHREGARLFVELGPGRGLTTMAGETLTHGDETFVAPLDSGDEAEGLARTLATAHVLGRRVDWPAVYGPRARPADLPLYPFQRRRHWLDSRTPDPAPPADPSALPPVRDPFELVVTATLEILGLEKEADLNLHRSFHDLGMDSRMAVALRTTLSRLVGRPLPATLLFDCPSPAALIEALEREDPR